jgi:chaperonin GroES
MELPIPINDQVLVRQDPPKEKLGSGLLYASQGNEVWTPFATVLRVGPGKWNRDGSARVELDVKPGDRVLFKRTPDTAIVPDWREGDERGWRDLLMLREDHIVGVVEDDEVAS